MATCLVAMLGGAGPAHAEPAIAGFSIAALSNEPIFGKASVGASSDTFARDLKRVNRYSLATNVSVTKLSIYLSPTSTSGLQVLKGLIYSDVSGHPETLLAVTEQLTFSSTSSAGWYDLKFASPVNLSAGVYWIGVITGATSRVAGYRYDTLTNARDWNENSYSSGPSTLFGAGTVDSRQISLYATYSAAPLDTAPPTISGAAQQGQTLTESNGTWTNSPTGYAYLWQRCSSSGEGCAAISGTTAQTYLLVAADIGHTIVVQETASNAAGPSAPASSKATAVVVAPAPVKEAPPTISGTAQQGQTLTEAHGSWTNGPTGYAYQWQRCNSSGEGCAAISGATAQLYLPVTADLEHSIRVQETASNAGGAGAPATSTPTGIVSPAPPENIGLPSITGTTQQGQMLTEVRGAWINEPTSYAYQWLQCSSTGEGCLPISDATAQTYVPAAADVGHTLVVEETASNASGPSAPASSKATAAVVPPAPVNEAPPTISGTAQQGQTLTEVHGTWTGSPTSYSYQWQQCNAEGASCTEISGAASQTYVPLASDVGHTLRAQETASNSSGATLATSEATPVVAGEVSEPTGLAGFKFITSIDTMKLSKDLAQYGFTAADGQAVDLAASTAANHITDNTPLEYPAVMVAWANRIHRDGKHVWFRLAATGGGTMAHADAAKSVYYQAPYDGYPGFGPGYLTKLHELMLANPGLVQPGDILDGDAEAENSSWWAANYGCRVQQGCSPCPDLAHMTAASYPCSPVSEFNRFLQVMSEQENRDLASLGITPCATPTSTNCVLTEVHSTDPGTAVHQLSNETVKAMGNLITVDAYPDQSTTEPGTAASNWTSALQSWENAWMRKGVAATILVGEWGYSNAINVTDVQQQEVVNAETKAFPTIPYLGGMNYWVGPGNSHDGGYTNIFIQESGIWKFRPAASVVSAFYATMSR